MSDPPPIIRDNETLFRHYQKLSDTNTICTRIRLKPGEEGLLTDLVERGVTLIPSATSQLASRSKAFQTRLFADFMLPGSYAIYDNHSLLNTISHYQKEQITQVVLKREGKNGGIGVHLFSNIEDIYNQVTGGAFCFPFVVQPFRSESRDIRVIILDDYIEAYERSNSGNFRNNLHCGGHSCQYTLSDKQILFCKRVMARGKFVYAHIDLLLSQDGDFWLTEINLRGGLRGASIQAERYTEKINSIHEKLLLLRK